MKSNRLFRILSKPNAAQLLAFSFIFLIFTGAVLLNLPVASNSGRSVGFLNALFTATSASCVTGQTVVNTAEQWNWFGRAVIIVLIQTGGLGVMTVIAIAMIAFSRNFSLRNRLVIQAAFNQDGSHGMARLITNVIKVTLISEGIGALLLTAGFYTSAEIDLTLREAAVYGLFHSISAFCNAGFDIVGESSMTPFITNPLINLTIMLLIISGGLGYPCWIELARQFKRILAKKLQPANLWGRLSVHTKIVLSVSAVFILGGALLFLLIERDNPKTIGAMTFGGKLWASLFQSVTLRTAGFYTVDQAGFHGSSQFLSCMLMLVGGSPAGTAGGIKTVTVGVIFFSMLNALKGRERITAFKRELSLYALQKALTVTTLLFLLVVGGAMLLRFTEHHNPYAHTFLDLLFECSSVSATVGLTTGITPHLSAMGKIILTILMFIGRLGPVTIVMSLTALNSKANAAGSPPYANTSVLIG